MRSPRRGQWRQLELEPEALNSFSTPFITSAVKTGNAKDGGGLNALRTLHPSRPNSSLPMTQLTDVSSKMFGTRELHLGLFSNQREVWKLVCSSWFCSPYFDWLSEVSWFTRTMGLFELWVEDCLCCHSGFPLMGSYLYRIAYILRLWDFSPLHMALHNYGWSRFFRKAVSW